MADLKGLIELASKPFERAENGISILHIVPKAPIQQIGIAVIESYLEGQLSAYTKPAFFTHIGDHRYDAGIEQKDFRSNLEVMLDSLNGNIDAPVLFFLDDHYYDYDSNIVDDCFSKEHVKLGLSKENVFYLMSGAVSGHITPFFDSVIDNNQLIIRDLNGNEVVNELVFDQELAMRTVDSYVKQIRKRDKAFDSLLRQAEKEAR